MSWRVRITLIVVLFAVTQKFSGEFRWTALPPLLCIARHHAALPHSMLSLWMCRAVRSTRVLIFDVSYGGLSCVNWNGDNGAFIWRIKRNIDMLPKVQVLETICGKYHQNDPNATAVQMIVVILMQAGWNSEDVHQTRLWTRLFMSPET